MTRTLFVALAAVGLLSFMTSAAYADKALYEKVCADPDDYGQDAIDACTALIQLDPKDAAAYDNRAWDEVDLDKAQAALRDSDTAIELAPDVAGYYADRARSEILLDRLPAALRDNNKAIELAPNGADFYADRAWTHRLLKQNGLALKDYDHAIDLAPNEAGLYMKRANFENYVLNEKIAAQADKAKACSLDNADCGE